MAVLDPDREQIVVRVVYDGPALSGKTTSLRALAGELGSELFSAAEAEGRTLYFDWLDYTGGRFAGFPIRCQVVSVPGQRALRTRREALLATADAIVFVADSRVPAGLAASLRMLSLPAVPGAGEDGLPPGIVVQANRRDSPEAAPLDELRQLLGGDGRRPVIESIATRADGVREAFVLAVRLALDRVRELWERGDLPRRRPEVDSGLDLLAAMRGRENPAHGSPAPPTLAAEWLGQALSAESTGPVAGSPLPGVDAPSGLVWPPIEGRVVLHEVRAEPPRLKRHADGSWASLPGSRWQVHTPAGHAFADPEASRRELLPWARWHGAHRKELSERRCLAVAPAADGSWRLWQIVRRERTLAHDLERALAETRPDRVAAGLIDVATAVAPGLRACERLGLPFSLDGVGASESGPRYVGWVPPPAQLPVALFEPSSPEECLRREFGRGIRHRASQPDFDVPRVLHHLAPLAARAGAERAGEVLATLLIGH